MQKLKFIYQNWNREYYELQSEEDTCSYYKNFYKGKEFKILPGYESYWKIADLVYGLLSLLVFFQYPLHIKLFVVLLNP